MIRLLFTALFLIAGLGVVPAPAGTANAAALGPTCEAFLVQEDAQATLDLLGESGPLLDEDRDGVASNDLPPLTATGLVRPEPPAHAKRGRVREIIDGDTISVSFGDTHATVQLIGVDTPETVEPNSPVECYGEEA